MDVGIRRGTLALHRTLTALGAEVYEEMEQAFGADAEEEPSAAAALLSVQPPLPTGKPPPGARSR